MEQFAIDDFSDALLRASTEGHVQVVQYFLALSAKLRQLAGQSKPGPSPRCAFFSAFFSKRLSSHQLRPRRYRPHPGKPFGQRSTRKQRERLRRIRKRERRRERRRQATELILDEEDLSAALAYACMNGRLLVVEMLILHVRAIAMDEFFGSQAQYSTTNNNSTAAASLSLSDDSMQEILLEGLQYACQSGHSRVVAALLPYLKFAPRKKLNIYPGTPLGDSSNATVATAFASDCDSRDMRPRKFFVNNERHSTPKEMVDEIVAMGEERKIEAKEMEVEVTEDSSRQRSLLIACLETAYRHDHWTCFQEIVSRNGALFQFSMDEILFPDDDGYPDFAFPYTSRFSADYLAQVLWVTIFRHLFIAIRLDLFQFMTTDFLSHVLSCFHLFSYTPYTISYANNAKSGVSNGTKSNRSKPSFLQSDDSDSLDIDEPEWKGKVLQRERIRTNMNSSRANVPANEHNSARMMCMQFDDYLEDFENSYDYWEDLSPPRNFEANDFHF